MTPRARHVFFATIVAMGNLLLTTPAAADSVEEKLAVANAMLRDPPGVPHRGLHGLSAYSASKAALIGLMRSLAQEGARCGIRVNAVAPYAHTGMTAHLMPPEIAASLRREYVAPLVVWFAAFDSFHASTAGVQ